MWARAAWAAAALLIGVSAIGKGDYHSQFCERHGFSCRNTEESRLFSQPECQRRAMYSRLEGELIANERDQRWKDRFEVASFDPIDLIYVNKTDPNITCASVARKDNLIRRRWQDFCPSDKLSAFREDIGINRPSVQPQVEGYRERWRSAGVFYCQPYQHAQAANIMFEAAEQTTVILDERYPWPARRLPAHVEQGTGEPRGRAGDGVEAERRFFGVLATAHQGIVNRIVMTCHLFPNHGL